MKKILILNGPNLNLLGKREPMVYGDKSFDDFYKTLVQEYNTLHFSYFQSNVEGELINKLHEIGFSYDGVIFNAGGYTHTSVSIADAVAAIDTPVVEVHISNVYSRQEYRHHSLMAASCKGVIAGFGLNSYHLAISSFL